MSKIKYDNLVIDIKKTDEHLTGNLGRYVDKESTITLSQELSGAYRRSILVHECTHMILTRLGEFKLNDDEGFVERLGNAIFRLYEENHDILLHDDIGSNTGDVIQEYEHSRIG